MISLQAKLLISNFCIAFVWSSVLTPLPYNCKIYGCDDGECNLVTGKCECNSPDMNFNCKEQGIAGVCDTTGIPCDDDNTESGSNNCVDDAQCLCKEGYFGLSCETPRLLAGCQHTSNNNDPHIHITVTPYGYAKSGDSFKGILYVQKDFTDIDFTTISSNCKSESSLDDKKIYVDDYSINECSQMVAGGGEFYTYVYIQHNKLFRSDVDQIIKMSCFDGVNSQPSVPELIIEISDADSTALQPLIRTKTTGSSETTLTLMSEASSGSFDPITSSTGPIDLGHDLSICISHPNSKFMVKSCTAQNYPFGEEEANKDDLKSLKLIDEWCVPSEALGVVRGASVIGASTGSDCATVGHEMFRLDIDAFYFPGDSHAIYIACDVCLDNCLESNPPVCSNVVTSYTTQKNYFDARRRRRDLKKQATSNSTDTLAVSINIGEINVDAQTSNSSLLMDEFEVTECFRDGYVILPIAIQSGLLMIALFIAGYFFQQTSKNPTAKSQDNAAFKM